MESQLIQRNDDNIGYIHLKGLRTEESFNQIGAYVLKNGNYYTSQKKNFDGNQFEFHLGIRAEMSEYQVKIYVYKNGDSTLAKEVKHLLCGENILVYGQSNALAVNLDEINRFDYTNDFARTTIEFVDRGEYLWNPVQKWNAWSSGMLGLEIQRNLINQFKVPIGIINGSLGNMSIVDLTKCVEGNHADKSTIYGTFLSKAQNLGAAESARILVWRQGEKEAFDENYKNDYDKNFDKLRTQLHGDFPALRKIYTFQNNIYYAPLHHAGEIRDFQRIIHSKYEDCEVVSTVGTPTFESLHYALEGFQKNGKEAAGLIARDFFGFNDLMNLTSPNLQKAYLSADKLTLFLEFDKMQQMVYPEHRPSLPNGTSRNIKDYIFLDGEKGLIESGSAKDNIVALKLNKPINAKLITYGLDFFTFDMDGILPGTTQLSNVLGNNALTFKNFPISQEQDNVQNDCPDEINLNYLDNVSTGEVVRMAQGKITASNQISGGNVRYKASVVDLNHGFDISSGSYFNIEIGGCK